MPHAHQTLVRLGAQLPFEHAAQELEATLGIQVTRATARRQTLRAGSMAQQIRTEQSQPSRGTPRFPIPQEKPADQLAMGSDGGMVPLRAGVWAEVKTVVIGQVQARKAGERGAKTTAHSYFTRMADAATFADLACVEITRRGVTQAKEVCAIQDGAEWLQGFVDGHRRDAVRILDFAHAAEYVGKVAEQGRLTGYHVPARWLPILLHELKHQGPRRVMKHLHWWNKHRPIPAVSDALRYFRKRLAHMAYPQFQAQGWPIGSGMVESANKVVMQARMKGAGMHWSPANVNPMLALRDEICNERWAESWGQQQQWRKEHQHQRRQQQAQKRRERALDLLKQQILRISLLMPHAKPTSQAPIAKGRTEGQKRWGRTTFSHKTLLCTPAKK